MQLIQNSPEWHQWRLEGIGASEVAAIIGICPYGTAYDVWQVKTGRMRGFEGNSFTQHGQELEAKARSLYEFINMEDMKPACAVHPLYSICRASFDGISGDGRRLLEIKCPKGQAVLDEALSGRVIEYYQPQVQYQLAVSGADELDFFVYHQPSNQHSLVKVLPSLVYQGALIARIIKFWQDHVVRNVPPPLTNRDVKLIENDSTLSELCEVIASKKDSLSKTTLDSLKARAIELGGHAKIRCGRVQISTVNRAGKFSFHKLTVNEPA